MENKLVLSNDAKRNYLTKLSKRLIKILYLIEEENNKQPNTCDEIVENSADGYILGQLFEVNSSNILFDSALTDVVIKLNSILEYRTIPFTTIRKQIFECKGIVDHLLKSL